jgi:hypothetical protein
MLKSITSKLVAVSASTVLASAIIASSASALNIAGAQLPCQPNSPRIALTSAGQVQGTCFTPGHLTSVQFDSTADPSHTWQEQAIVPPSGTFTVPWDTDPYIPRNSLNSQVTVSGCDTGSGYFLETNTLVVNLGLANQPIHMVP